MEGSRRLEVPSSGHPKVTCQKSDSYIVVNEGSPGGKRREKDPVSRTHSLPGDPMRHQASFKRTRSTRRSCRSHQRDNLENGRLAGHPKNKTDLLIQNAIASRNDPGGSPVSNTSFQLVPPYSPGHLRSPSVRSKKSRSSVYKDRSRRQSAWSGEQMRGDFAEIVHKYANPQSIFSISVVLVLAGVVCIVVAIGSSSKVLNIIGITFIVLGVIVFVVGAVWFYGHARNGRPSNVRTRLKLIQLQYSAAADHEDNEEVNQECPEEKEKTQNSSQEKL